MLMKLEECGLAADEMPIDGICNNVSWNAKCYIFCSNLRHIQTSWSSKFFHATNVCVLTDLGKCTEHHMHIEY